jgi:predicted transposase/invertase (TIGR01784 family)
LSDDEKEELFKMNDKIYDVDEIVKIVMENDDVSDALYNAVMDRNLEMLKKRKAYEDGKKEKEIEIAKNLKKQGLDIKIIITATGLTKEEIENIK